MRKQYYFRPSGRGLLAWDVDRLVQLSSRLPRKRIPLDTLSELDQVWCGEKAVLRGLTEIGAVRFGEDPAPDHVGVQPNELPY